MKAVSAESAGGEAITSRVSHGNIARSMPILSVVDLSILEHDPKVEDLLFDVLPNGPPECEEEDSDMESFSSLMEDFDITKDVTYPASLGVPVFEKVDEATREYFELPPVLHALCGIDHVLLVSQMSVKELCVTMATEDCSLHPEMPPLGHVDGGSMANTTNRMDYLFGHKEFVGHELLKAPQLRVADDTVHRPLGKGHFKVPTNNSAGFL